MPANKALQRQHTEFQRSAAFHEEMKQSNIPIFPIALIFAIFFTRIWTVNAAPLMDHPPTNLKLSLSASDEAKKSDESWVLNLSFENIGVLEFALNLGMILPFEKPFFMQQFKLKATDSEGKMLELANHTNRIGVLPKGTRALTISLLPGARYILKLRFNDYGVPSAGIFEPQLDTGAYSIKAVFTGNKPFDFSDNSMYRNMANFWEGTLESNVLIVEKK